MRRKLIAVIKLALLLLFCVGLPLSIFLQHPEVLDNFRSLETLNAFLERYKTAGIFVYLLLQIVQILIPVIPGQALQLAAGTCIMWFLDWP